MRERLRIAIQKSGRLSEPARALLASCGLSWRESRDRLFCYGESLPVDLLLVRDDDIPRLIADGVCDLGIVGRNVLAEQVADAKAASSLPAFREWRALGFGACRLDLAVPEDWDWRDASQLAGKRIATSYPAIARAMAATCRASTRRSCRCPVRSRSRRSSARPTSICDLVSSGATLAANQLKPVLTLLQSEAVLAGPVKPFTDVRAELADLLLRRMDGVLRLKDSKLLLFQAQRQTLPALMKLLPDAEPPTVMPVDGTDTLALQALCHGVMTWQRLEDLKRAGACGLHGAAGREDAGMKRLVWSALDEAARADALERPTQAVCRPRARERLRRSCRSGRSDAAMRPCASSRNASTRCELETFAVGADEFADAERAVSAELREAMEDAAARIEAFHRAGMTHVLCRRDRAGRDLRTHRASDPRASACTCLPAARRCRRPR